MEGGEGREIGSEVLELWEEEEEEAEIECFDWGGGGGKERWEKEERETLLSPISDGMERKNEEKELKAGGSEGKEGKT